MRKNGLSLCLVTLCFLLASSVASASIADCNTLGTVNVLTIGSCTATLNGNTYTFSNFNDYVASGNSSSWTGLNMLGYTTSGDEIIMSFNPNQTGGGVTDVHLQYEVTGPDIVGGDLALAPADAGASISEENCTSNPSVNQTTLDGTNCATSPNPLLLLSVSTITGPTSVPQTNFAAGAQSNVWVWKDILITAIGHDSSFNESLAATPEPMTLSVVGIGLLGIGLLGRRVRR